MQIGPELILLIILIAVLYIIYTIIYYLKSNKEYFSVAVPYDLGAYLAVYEEYKRFYEDRGKMICKQPNATEPLCSAYGGIIGSGYVYSPPILNNTQTFTEARQLVDRDFSGVDVTATVALERAVFTYYCERPNSFNYAATYNTKTAVERYIDENCRLMRHDIAASGYVIYMTISGKNYEIRKAFTGVRDVLGCAKTTAAGRQLGLFVGVGIEAPAQYGRWAGEESNLFTLLLEAASQKELDAALVPASASGSATASAAGAGAGAGATAPASNLQLSAITYLPDARVQNKKRFDAMYNALQNPSAAITSYYKKTNITAPTDSYVATVAKFIQLDKWILAGATVGNVVDSSQLFDKTGNPYTFKVPVPYNPAIAGTLGADNKETVADPLESAVDLKSYELEGLEADIMTYFKTRRNYGSAAINTAIAEKLREGICASAGYYTNTTSSKCKCTTGCCIPVAYKAKASCLVAGAGAGAGASVAPPNTTVDLSADSQAILGKVDNCVHMHSQFKLVRAGPTIRIGPSPTCIETREGFIDLPANYGGAVGAAKIKGQMQELKGWAMSPLGRAVSRK